MELQKIKIDLLEQNTGQVSGLPANPRQWTRTELDKLVKSIQETPELLEARGLIVKRIAEDRYVVLGGNMRLDACRKLGYMEIPCFVLPDDTPVDKLKEIVIKDNGSFGGWDWDAIANEWNDLCLLDWGVPVFDNEHDDKATPAADNDLSNKIGDEYKLEVDCENESVQEELFNRLTGEGYTCRVLTL